jgi:hypothetical protein
MAEADPLRGREDLNQRQEMHLGVIGPNRHRAQPPTLTSDGNARQRCNIRIPMLPASGDGHGRAGGLSVPLVRTPGAINVVQSVRYGGRHKRLSRVRVRFPGREGRMMV